MTLDDSLRQATRIRRDDYDYIVHPLLDGVPRVPAELLEEWLEWACIQPMLDHATVLVAPEAMGVPLAAILTLETGIPYVVARKRPYGLPGEQALDASTGYHQARLHLNDIGAADTAVVVDDVLSTGGTLDAILGGITAAGAKTAGVLVAVDKGDAREGLATRHDVPILAMRRIRVKADAVRIERN